MSDLRELYQEIILDHNKNPRNFGALPSCNRSAKGHNPLCGDMVTTYLFVEDGVVKDVRFDGKGCAISIASASIMTSLVVGKPEAAVRAMFDLFHAFVTNEDRDDLGAGLEELTALGGVRDYPMRVKCATLPWHSVIAALDAGNSTVITE
tara:strand:+ start:133 stop:582 length:450 start_codon:yes stop_codon:yes gene_type:complete